VAVLVVFLAKHTDQQLLSLAMVSGLWMWVVVVAQAGAELGVKWGLALFGYRRAFQSRCGDDFAACDRKSLFVLFAALHVKTWRPETKAYTALSNVSILVANSSLQYSEKKVLTTQETAKHALVSSKSDCFFFLSAAAVCLRAGEES
jgi:hypothetical protein